MLDGTSPCWSPSAGINQFRFVRSTAAAALSARFPRAPAVRSACAKEDYRGAPPASRARDSLCYDGRTNAVLAEGAMKIGWFHLMPYRFLPDDFEQRYRSVWVDPPHHLFDPEKTSGLYHEFLDELEFAEQAGFDGLCVNEHHNNAYGLMPSPNLMAAALTRRTSRAALVVLGNSLAAYNPPLRVAEEFAMLDLMSGGRLVAGFPVGTSMDMNFAYGINPATLRDRYYEAHDLVIQ